MPLLQPSWTWTLRLILLMATLALLGGHWWVLLNAPGWWAPEAIRITLEPGQSTVLGRQELAARQADKAHLALRRDAAGVWWAGNASGCRKVLAMSTGQERSVRSQVLTAGMDFRVGPHSFHVEAADSKALVFRGAGGESWTFDGANLSQSDKSQPACTDARLHSRLLTHWNQLAPGFARVKRPMTFGGRVYCNRQLALPDLDPQAAEVSRQPSGFELAPRGCPAQRPLLTVTRPGEAAMDLSQTEIPLAGVDALVLGRTHYSVALDQSTLRLRPLHRVALTAEALTSGNPAVQTAWAQRDPWQLPTRFPWAWASPAALLIVGLTGLLLAGRWPFDGRTAWPVAVQLAAACSLAALGATAYGLASRLGTGWLVALLSAAVGLWLTVPARSVGRVLALGCGLLLLTSGLLVQLEMGLGAAESHWPFYYHRGAALASLGLAAAWALRLRLQCGLPWPPMERIDAMLWAMAGLACMALLVQAAAGDETGVGGIQPVEFAKLALVLFAAHALAGRLAWQGRQTVVYSALGLWARYLMPMVLFMALVAAALVLVNDFSPLVLLACWLLGIACAYALAARSLWASLLLGLFIAGLVVTVWELRHASPEALAKLDFYLVRFAVWIAPELHAHTGAQVLQGVQAMQAGQWWGPDGMPLLGGVNGKIMSLPVIQDDFSPSFLVWRHGLAGGLALMLVQAGFVLGLLAVGWQELASAARGGGGDFRRAWLARFTGFALWGGAAFVLGHFMVSWGSNTGALPVMGQPMSFLSSGGSHTLLFLLPLLSLSVINPD